MELNAKNLFIKHYLITNSTFSPMQPFSFIKANQLDFTAASSQTLAL